VEEKEKGQQVLYDYVDSSVHDVRLRADLLRGYEQFKASRIILRYDLHLQIVAHSWVIYIDSLYIRTTGIGDAAGEILHCLGVDVEHGGWP
jgi:hypothetical protein